MTTKEEVTLLKGVYHEATVGFTVLEDGSPMWSVDIDSHIDGVRFNGTAASLDEAAWQAAAVAIRHSQDVKEPQA